MPKCLKCDGSGKISCNHCNGEGTLYIKSRVWDDIYYKYEYEYKASFCGKCFGIGSVKCMACDGKGIT